MHQNAGRSILFGTLLLAAAAWAALTPATAGFGVAQAQADVLRIAAVVSSTGPSSALGLSEANTLELLQRSLEERSGARVDIQVYDDASEVAKAVELVNGILAEGNVDAIICCTRSEAALAVVAPAEAARMPLVSLAAAAPITHPVQFRRWVFSTAPADSLILGGVVADMAARGISDISFLGLSDAFGESGLMELQLLLPGSGITLDKVARYTASDSSYSAPVLAAMLSRPQAVLVWGIVDDSARMVRELRDRGFGGDIYVSHGVGNDRFISEAGSAAEGVRLVVGPLLVADDLAANAPNRDADLAYREAYTAAYPGETVTTFGGHAHDAVMALVNAYDYASANTSGFASLEGADRRLALRDAMEAMGPFVGVGGVFDFTGTDHNGLDSRSYVVAEIQGGAWRLATP